MAAMKPQADTAGVPALPLGLMQQVFLVAGPVVLARAAATHRAWGSLRHKADFWDEFCRQIWPGATLARVAEDYGGSCREALIDRNRRGAMIAWRPKAEDSVWTWKHNGGVRFYCGRATLLALDEVTEELCVFVHALTNYPDLRSASTSVMHEVKADSWQRNCMLRQGAREMRPKQPVEVQREKDQLEEKVVLRWPASSFQEGHVYVFTYACQGHYCGGGDYESVPLVDLSDVSTGRGGDGGDWPVRSSYGGGLRTLWHAAGQAQAGSSALYVQRSGHVDRPELEGLPRNQMARTLLEGVKAVPESWKD